MKITNGMVALKRSLKRRVGRWRAGRRRRAKQWDVFGWLPRWDAACRKCWLILHGTPKNAERFRRFERNHQRLMRLAMTRTLKIAGE